MKIKLLINDLFRTMTNTSSTFKPQMLIKQNVVYHVSMNYSIIITIIRFILKACVKVITLIKFIK